MQNDGERRFLRLELKNIKITSLESILDYIYTGLEKILHFSHTPLLDYCLMGNFFTGKLRYEEENFGSLIDDARRMEFDKIIHVCEEHLAQSVSIENWDNLLLCAHFSQKEEIVSECFKFIEAREN